MRISGECRATRREIEEAEVNGRLTTQSVEHLAGCVPCREFREQRSRLRELVGSLQPVNAPADFDMRLRARLAGKHAAKASWFMAPRFISGRPALALAAAIIVLVGVGAFLTRTRVISRHADEANVTPTSPRPEKSLEPQTLAASLPSGDQSKGGGNSKDEVAPKKTMANFPRPAGDSGRSMAARQSEIRSNDFGLQPAPVYRPNSTEPNAAEISLSKPFEFSLQDGRGVTHKISLPPVSFGSQLVQNEKRFQPASYAANRIW